MSRVTLGTVIKRAIPAAIRDREALADAYSNTGEHAEEAVALVKKLQGIARRRLSAMSPEELKVAYAALVFAEQWEASFADSRPGEPYEKAARDDAKLYREMRLRYWGPTQMEALMANAGSVDIRAVHESTP